MTATIATAADLDGVIRRADARWAGRHGDEPALPEYLTVLADAVRPLLGHPPAGPGDDGQAQQLLADNQRLQDLVDELRRHVDARDRTIDRQKTTVEQAKAELANARRAAAAKLAAADAEIERLTARTAELDGQLQARAAIIARRDADITQLHAAVDELRAKLTAVEQAKPPHQHRYPVDAPGTEPRPCACGQPYPRTAIVTEVVKPSPPEPWASLLGQIRAEARKAGWTA
jgi:septal ring factor EnvC (AmiA/AmiB activator)